MYSYTLSEEEKYICHKLTHKVAIEAYMRERVSKKMSTKSEYEISLNGFGSEIAFGRMLNISPRFDGRKSKDSGDDLYDFTHHEHGTIELKLIRKAKRFSLYKGRGHR